MNASVVDLKAVPTHVKPSEGLYVRILDDETGEVLTLAYDGAMTTHKSSLWWGTAVGYRAMQAAAIALSQNGLWSRKDIYVVSGHPGPGVIDSIDYITKAKTRDRCTVIQNPNCANKCNSSMKFEWWVSDGKQTAKVTLREDFVGPDFYDLSDRLGSPEETDEDRRQFEISKVNLSTRIWNADLEENFTVEIIPTPLKPGEIPKEATLYWLDK